MFGSIKITRHLITTLTDTVICVWLARPGNAYRVNDLQPKSKSIPPNPIGKQVTLPGPRWPRSSPYSQRQRCLLKKKINNKSVAAAAEPGWGRCAAAATGGRRRRRRRRGDLHLPSLVRSLSFSATGCDDPCLPKKTPLIPLQEMNQTKQRFVHYIPVSSVI